MSRLKSTGLGLSAAQLPVEPMAARAATTIIAIHLADDTRKSTGTAPSRAFWHLNMPDVHRKVLNEAGFFADFFLIPSPGTSEIRTLNNGRHGCIK